MPIFVTSKRYGLTHWCIIGHGTSSCKNLLPTGRTLASLYCVVQFVFQLELTHHRIQATVLLNANMSFLAIQSVDNNGDKTFNRSAAQIASYISIVTSLGTVILSLLLVREYRSKGSAGDAAKFLGNIIDPYGLETLAIWFALPYALLMWSALTFLTAFSLMCFSHSSLATRIPVGSVLLAVSVLIIWCIGLAWVKGNHKGERWLFSCADLWESCRSMLPGGSSEMKQKRPAGSPTLCANFPTDDGRKEGKRQWSWPPQLFLRKPTSDSPFDNNEMETV